MSPADRELNGRHAVVTGGGGGLGRAIAAALVGAGATVTLASRNEAGLSRAAAEIGAGEGRLFVQPTDVTDDESVERLVEAANSTAPVSILVTAAGLNRTGPTADYPVADWDLLMDVNVKGTFLPCRAFGRRMVERGEGGSIVTVSSQMGLVGYPGRAAYCASKHAVNGLTKALAVEWAPAGITVNAIAPTFVETALTRPMFDDPDFAADVARRIPGGEIATVDDVAAAALFLASPGARAITGHVLAVDRGWTAW
jgi:NAD(P)-dependent dehydrogenase (short-subunit alcohol dehydrogenase family)